MPKHQSIRLPRALVEEIHALEATDHLPKFGTSTKISRKEARRQERTDRKQRKASFFSGPLQRNKRTRLFEHADSPQRKRPKLNDGLGNRVAERTQSDQVGKEPQKSKKTGIVKSSPKPAAALKKPPRSRQDMEEDTYIAYLEAKLGYVKDGKRKVKQVNDGLDDLLDLADSLVKPYSNATDHGSEQDESESVQTRGSEDTSGSMDLEPEDSDVEEWGGIQESELGDLPSPGIGPPPEVPKSGAKYIPPHLREPESHHQSESFIKLQKQLKGLLNRVSEQNLATILESIEEVYRNHRRNDVTSTLTDLIIHGIASHSSLLDSYVVLHAALVSSLHKIIGIEFAAYFVQQAVSSYERYHALLPDQPSTCEVSQPTEDGITERGKECQNLVVLLSELYNFQVISCVLVYDVIRSLLSNDLYEIDVELLLKLVRNSGQQLRRDDPSALKDIIDIVHNKLAGKGDSLSSRTRFMVETLTNLKNNKLKRNTTQNQGGEAVERMKKFLSGLGKKRHVLAHEPLHVSLEDLHSAERKGKWWLVGAAWQGDPLVDRQRDNAASQELIGQVSLHGDTSNSLLKLARKQGMNTDIRRSIFVVLMSSEDYVDACERLSQLNLTEVQQREIIRVILHCCGNEKTYNPYYALIGQQLCQRSYSYKVTLQFCLWDFLRDLGETNVGGAEIMKNAVDDFSEGKKMSATRLCNVARAYAWWIAKNSVALTILKPVDFTTLKLPTREFLKELFMHVFVNSQLPTPWLGLDPKGAAPASRNRGVVEEIFIRGSRIEALAMGITYFLSDIFRGKHDDDNASALIKWAVGVAKDTLRTGVDIIPNL